MDGFTDCYVVFDQYGMPIYTSMYYSECNQHINEMCEIETFEAGKWVIREMVVLQPQADKKGDK